MFAGQRQSVDNRSQFLPNHQHHNANDAVNDDCDSGGNHASTDEHLLFGDGGGFFGPVTPLSPSSEALDPQILLLPRTNQQSANNFMLSPSLIAAGAGAGVSGMDRSPGSSVLRSMISECLVPFSPFPSATAGTWLVSSPPDAIQSVISTSQPTAVRDMNDSFRHLYNIFSSSTFTSSTTTAAAASSSSSSTSSSASSSSSSSTALSTPDGGSLFQPNDSDTLPPSNGGGKKKRNKAYHCENCFVEHAPTWRKSPTGGRLCNACGLYLKLHGKHRRLANINGCIRVERSKKRQHSILIACTGCLMRSNISSLNELTATGWHRDVDSHYWCDACYRTIMTLSVEPQ